MAIAGQQANKYLAANRIFEMTLKKTLKVPLCRRKIMIILDLKYLEDIDVAANIIGGSVDKNSIKLPDVNDILKKVNKKVKKTTDKKKKGGGKKTTVQAVSKKGNAKAIVIAETEEW